jgi:uncharacterized protein YutE (UPF0331/DUF86 family)
MFSFTLTSIIVFRTDIHKLLGRLRRGKFLGQELELGEETQKVERQVEAAEQAEPAKPLLDPAKDTFSQLSNLQAADERVQHFLIEASQDKLLALLRIWIEIEQQVRTIVATNGFLESSSRQSVREYVKVLAQNKIVSQETADSIANFYELRSRLVHGRVGKTYRESELLALIDSGLRLLEILRLVPRQTYKVSAVVPFFSDPAATVRVEGARAVILETTPSDGGHVYAAYPTTKAYERGQMLSWEWNMRKVWGRSWYKDPQSGETKLGWDSAAEFVGRPLETIE